MQPHRQTVPLRNARIDLPGVSLVPSPRRLAGDLLAVRPLGIVVVEVAVEERVETDIFLPDEALRRQLFLGQHVKH